jgi:hypothetical protein
VRTGATLHPKLVKVECQRPVWKLLSLAGTITEREWNKYFHARWQEEKNKKNLDVVYISSRVSKVLRSNKFSGWCSSRKVFGSWVIFQCVWASEERLLRFEMNTIRHDEAHSRLTDASTASSSKFPKGLCIQVYIQMMGIARLTAG